ADCDFHNTPEVTVGCVAGEGVYNVMLSWNPRSVRVEECVDGGVYEYKSVRGICSMSVRSQAEVIYWPIPVPTLLDSCVIAYSCCVRVHYRIVHDHVSRFKSVTGRKRFIE